MLVGGCVCGGGVVGRCVVTWCEVGVRVIHLRQSVSPQTMISCQQHQQPPCFAKHTPLCKTHSPTHRTYSLLATGVANSDNSK